MSDIIQEAKEILACFGIYLPEDQPWIVEPEYSKRTHLLIHLVDHGRGLAMEYKGDPITFFISNAEKYLEKNSIEADLSGILEKHRDTEEFYIWLADFRDYLQELGYVFLYFDGLDDLIFFDILPESEAEKLQGNSLFRRYLRETKHFLDPNNWGTMIVEDI